MPGAVAAGDRETARAGVEILRMGGNAVDAAIAATAASFLAEPMLASAGGAGVMTVAMPDSEPSSIDFFSDMPGLGGWPDELDFYAYQVDFGPVTQEFHVGRGAAAAPGALPGLAEVHRRFGSLPLTDLVAPAVRLADEGVIVSPASAHVYSLLWGLLCRDPYTREIMTHGRLPRAGDRVRNPDLAGVLREFARLGRTPDRVVEGMLEHFGPACGGLVTERDVVEFRPIVTTPRCESAGDWCTYFARTLGGRAALRILQNLAAGTPEESEADEYLRFARASGHGHSDRQRAITRGSTTHISVVDSAGGVASVTVTNGEGCGHVIPGTGIQLNNFLGEADINPQGFHRYQSGERITTMMAPTVARHARGATLALGSGGSNRIRTAVGSTVYRVVGLGQSVEQAVLAPRVHAEDQTAWLELESLEHKNQAIHALYRGFLNVHTFERRDFFFGGVHTVARDEHGRLSGIGDIRRGGVCLFSE